MCLFRLFPAIIVLSLVAVWTTGCSTILTSRTQKAPLMALYTAGNYPQAVNLITEKSEAREGTGDELIWLTEEGSICYVAGDYEKSLKALERAEVVIEDYENRAEISARDGGAEAGAVATNLNALPYKGNYIEKILINAYKALAYFGQDKKDAAWVELRRMRNRQKQAREDFDSQIAAAEKEAQEKNADAKKIMAGIPEMNEIKQSVQKHSVKKYGDFVNPFATYLSAMGYMQEGKFTEAMVDFRNLYKMDAKNPLIQQDFVTCAKETSTQIPSELSGVKPWGHSMNTNVVYVIYANGMTAAKKGFHIHLPLPPPVAGYTGVPIPIMEYFPTPYSGLEIKTAAGSYSTVTVTDMDSIMTEDYWRTLPIVLVKTFISVAAKETANYFAQREAKKHGDAAYIATIVGTSVYKAMFNTADTRCWRALPKYYEIIHFPRPEDGKIVIQTKGGSGVKSTEITLQKKAKMTIIYVNSPGQGVLSVNVCELD